MKFTCEKALLTAAVSTASRAVAAKSSIAAMEGLLVEATDQLTLTGYNMETGIRATVPSEIDEPGKLVLNSRLFGDIVRKLPDDVVIFSSEGMMVNIRCGMSEYNIAGIDPDDFPELPTVDQQNGIIINQSTLREMISQTIFAVSDNENRPIHTGALFEVDDMELTMVAVDGYRLALRRENFVSKSGAASFSFVVPGKALNEVERICSGDGTVSVSQGSRHIMFMADGVVLVCRRLEGDFLAYRNAIPRNGPVKIEVENKALQACVDRVSLIITEKLKAPMRCVFKNGLVFMSAKTAMGDAADQCVVNGDGGGLEIGFNNRYISEALKAAPAEKLRLELTSGVAPCVIVPAEGEEKFIYMVLPVRLKAN